MLSLKLHHIGYLVKKKKAQEAFLALGYTIIEDWVHDEGRGIDISFLSKDGCCIELVCPFSKESIVSGLIARLKNSPYHICYISENMEQDLETLRDQGYLPMTEPAGAPALKGHPVVFLMHPSLGMIELIDRDPGELPLHAG